MRVSLAIGVLESREWKTDEQMAAYFRRFPNHAVLGGKEGEKSIVSISYAPGALSGGEAPVAVGVLLRRRS